MEPDKLSQSRVIAGPGFDDEQPSLCWRLLDIELKLKGMAYLIEVQGLDVTPLPWDEQDIHRGVSLDTW